MKVFVFLRRRALLVPFILFSPFLQSCHSRSSQDLDRHLRKTKTNVQRRCTPKVGFDQIHLFCLAGHARDTRISASLVGPAPDCWLQLWSRLQRVPSLSVARVYLERWTSLYMRSVEIRVKSFEGVVIEMISILSGSRWRIDGLEIISSYQTVHYGELTI